MCLRIIRAHYGRSLDRVYSGGQHAGHHTAKGSTTAKRQFRVFRCDIRHFRAIMKFHNPGLNMNRHYFPVKFSRWLLMSLGMLFATLLSACGGGGGTVGLPTGTALYTTAPTTVTVAAGVSQSYTIGGGTPIYRAATSNKDVATASASGTGLTITGVAGGSATISITDAAGASTSVAVVVSAPPLTPVPPAPVPPALFTSAAGSLTVAVGATSIYSIGGGVPAYAVSSSNNSVATVTRSGADFNVTGVATGTAEVVVTDAAGTALTLAVKVGGGTAPSALFTTAPSNITVAVNASATFSMGGGTAPYNASSSNGAVAKVAASGNAILVTGVSPGIAQIVLVDSAGASITVSVTVGTGGGETALFLTAADAVTLAINEVGSYAIGGGKPAYSVSTSNASVARVALNGSGFTVTGAAAGSAVITVTDAAGATSRVTLTVSGAQQAPPPALFTTAAGSLTVAVGATSTYGIGGGVPAYMASSSNTSVATVTLNGNSFGVTGVGSGTAEIVVTDAVGTALSLSVKVGGGAAPTAFFTTAPSNITVAIDASASFSVGGGTAPYSASTSNAGVVRAAVNGSAIVFTGVSQGTAQIVLKDSAGDSVTVDVTVGTLAPETALFLTAPEAVTLSINEVGSYTIGGGKPAYSVSTSNASVARVVLNGNGFTVTGAAAGSAVITITDAAGATSRVALTVSGSQQAPPTALFTTAAGSLTVAVGATSNYSVGGGVPAYMASSSNTSVATVTLNGSSFGVTGLSNGTAEIVVTDAVGTSLSLSVKVGGGAATTAFFTTAPSNVTMTINASASFSLGGGTPPYSASSSNAAVVRAAINGSAIVFTGVSQGTAQIVLKDSAGDSITVDVTVGTIATETALFLTAPDAIELAVNEVGTYSVGGGKPAYSASTSNASVARVAVNGTSFSITAAAPGTAKVTITDLAGAARLVDVTVSSGTPPPPAPPPPSIAPASAAGNVGDTLTFLINGGTPGFTITVNNPSIATVASASGNTFTVNLNNVGETSATITDAAGRIVALPITVNQTTTSLRLSPNALLVAEDYTGSFALNIFGGTGPYRAFTSDQTLSSVSIVGNVLTVGLGTNNNRCINPITPDGTYIPNGTFDITVTTLDSLGASATSTMTIKDNGRGLSTGCP